MGLSCSAYENFVTDFHLSGGNIGLKKHSEALTRKCSVKKVFLESSQNSQENNCAQVSFCRCNFIKKEALAQEFSCEFCEISKNTFSYRTVPVTASDHSKEFSRNVVAPVYDTLKNFLLSRKQFSIWLRANKMSAKHRKRLVLIWWFGI